MKSFNKAQNTDSTFQTNSIYLYYINNRGHIILNVKSSIYLFWLNEKPFLHIIDTETVFQNDVCIRDKSSKNLWTDFINYMAFLHSGLQVIAQINIDRSFTSL